MNLPDCPIPTQKYDRIVMAHGGGGRMTSRLIEKIFYPAFQNKWLEQAHDGATLNLPSARIAITTDSFVVDPIVLSRGKHRGLGYKRDRKRFTVLRSHSSLFIGRIYIRRRLTHRDIETDRTNHAKSGRESRCLYRHRRHQSRRTRQMRQDLHQHDRSRDRPRKYRYRTSPYQERRCRNRHRRYRESRNLYSLHTRQFRFRDLYPKRYGGTHPNRL